MVALSRRRRADNDSNIWPGWVDALSSLLMVVIFVLMVFMVAQFALTNALTGKDTALLRLNQRVAELADLLALEKNSSAELRDSVAQLTAELQASLAAKDALSKQLDTLTAAQQAKLSETQAQIATLDATRGELERRLSQEQAVSEEGRQQVALLNQQIDALRRQLAEISALLETSEAKNRDQEAQITDLGRRLNVALASKVQELARYRSEFFGRLREALGDRKDIRIVGDRFVFQSEVLFPTASADLGDAGEAQLAQLAQTLKEVAAKIPPDVDWILRVDGHTDVRAIKNDRFPSNWELSTARAVEVVKFLNAQGIPADRLAAAGFGQYQPLENATTEDAYARNRRIELKLDQRGAGGGTP